MPPVDPFVKAQVPSRRRAPIVATTHGYLTPWIPPPSPEQGEMCTTPGPVHNSWQRRSSPLRVLRRRSAPPSMTPPGKLAPPSCRSGSLRKTAPPGLPSGSSTPWPSIPRLALVRASPTGPVRRAMTPSAGFPVVDESLLDLVAVAGQGIVGLQHREPTLVVAEPEQGGAFGAQPAHRRVDRPHPV